MNQRKPSPDKDLLAMIERVEEMKREGKILYLDAEQYEDIIEYYIHEKNYAKASEMVQMAMQIHPDNSRLIATQVALYIDEDKIKEARELLNKILADTSFHVRLIHAELLVVEGREKEAKAILDEFKEEDTDEIDCLDIGILCCDIGFYERALYWLEKCLEFNPENEDAVLTICECYQSLGRYNETIALYNKLIDKDPYSAEFWAGLGKSYFYLGEHDKAIEASDFAIVSDENTGEAYTVRGHAYYQLENYQEAVDAYKKAWRLGSLENEFAAMFIAFSYIGLEEWDNAHEYLKKAIARTNENSPVFSDLLINSARCLYNMDRKEEAHNTLKFTRERYPDNILAYIYDGRFYLEEGKREEAVLYFGMAANRDPSADTWYQIGLMAINCQDFEIAKNAFDHVQEIDPNYEDLPKSIGLMTQLAGGEQVAVNKKMLKEHLRSLVAKGGDRPETIDIEEFIAQARLMGKSEEEIKEMVDGLKQLNDLLENFDIDQEEDEDEL